MTTQTLDPVPPGELPEHAGAPAAAPAADEPAGVGGRRLPTISALRPLSPAPTYIGVAVTTAGFVLLAIAWGGVAGNDDVVRQLPYLVSGGLAGLGLILVGLTVINISAKRRDAALREQQIQLLAAALGELRGEPS